MPAFDAGAAKPLGQGDGRYFRFRGQAILTSPSQCIEFSGLPSIVTSTFVSFEAGAEPFSPEYGYTDDFTDATINARTVVVAVAAPFQSQSPIAFGASAGSVFIRPQPQTTVPSEGSPLTVEYDVIFREGHRDTSVLGLLRAGITSVSAVFAGMLNVLPWGVFHTSPAVRTDGQGGPLEVDANGRLLVSSAPVTTGDASDTLANPTTNTVIAVIEGWSGSVWQRLKSSIVTPTATLTGWLNTLPWAVYNAVPTVRTEGQGGPLQADSDGSLRVTLAKDIRGENATTKRLDVSTPHSTAQMTTATTTTHLTGAGRYRGMRLGFPVASADIKVYDNTAASGAIIDQVTLPATLLSECLHVRPCDVPVTIGVTAITSQATKVHIDWNANP